MNIAAQSGEEPGLLLTLRSRTENGAVEKKTEWQLGKTALIICDMWDIIGASPRHGAWARWRGR